MSTNDERSSDIPNVANANPDNSNNELAPLPPNRLLILMCMDRRLRPESFPDYVADQTYVVRNAGGRAAEGLRSVIVSQQFLKVTKIAVIHHTKCGMVGLTDEGVRGQLVANPPKPNRPLVRVTANATAFLPITTDLETSVKDDVIFLQEHPLVRAGTPVSGWIFDIDGRSYRKIVGS